MSWYRTATWTAAVAAAGATVASVLGLFGAWWWVLDLFAHFRVQYVAVLGVAVAGALATRRWRVVAGAGAALALNLAVVAPLWLGSPAAAAAGAEPVRIVAFNALRTNPDHAAVAEYLAAANADIVVAFEVTGELDGALRETLGAYAYGGIAASDSFGIAVFARGAVGGVDVFPIVERSDIPAARVVVERAGQRYAVLAVHTMPPIGSANSALRDDMLAAAANWAQAQTDPAIVVGDFNATPWSHAFGALLDDGDLINSQRGFGVHASWGPWAMRIPIDHCVHSPTLTTVARQVGPFLGSDHRSIYVEVAPRAP